TRATARVAPAVEASRAPAATRVASGVDLSHGGGLTETKNKRDPKHVSPLVGVLAVGGVLAAVYWMSESSSSTRASAPEPPEPRIASPGEDGVVKGCAGF